MAERLVAQAAAEASARIGAAAVKPPPAGWQASGGEDGQASSRVSGEFEQLLQALTTVRDMVPPDLQQRLAEALHQLLLAVRALVDWYFERVEQRRASPVEVQDIPVL